MTEIEKLITELKMSYEEYFEEHKDELVKYDDLEDIKNATTIEIEPKIQLFTSNGVTVYLDIKAHHKIETYNGKDCEIIVETNTQKPKKVETICEELFNNIETKLEPLFPDEYTEADYWFDRGLKGDE